MEVLAAVEAKCDDFLKEKFAKAVERVKRSIELYGAHAMAFSFNGGKDSTVLLHIIRAAIASLQQQEQQDGEQQQNGELGCLGGMHCFFFARTDDFPELEEFVRDMDSRYSLRMRTFDGDFIGVLEGYVRDTGVRAIVIGTRRGDPNAAGQEVWCPSSPGWPPFMRVNPVLDWSYRDVWAFLLALGLPYCSLYDRGYTSLGGTANTVPNSALQLADGTYSPAHRLTDERLERAGRSAKPKGAANGALANGEELRCGSAALAIVGDEILSGKVEDLNTSFLCQQLHALGWRVSRAAVLPDDVVVISTQLQALLRDNDVVITAGGVGPTLDDVTMAAVADALHVPLARNPGLEAAIRQHFGTQVTDAHLKMAQAPEGTCELIEYTLDGGERSAFPLALCGGRVYVLPGVPHLLRQKWKAVKQHLEGRAETNTPFRSVALRLAVADEASVAPLLERLAEQAGSGVQIGSYPVSGQDDAARLVVSLESKDLQALRQARAALLLEGEEGLPAGALVGEEWDAPCISRKTLIPKP